MEEVLGEDAIQTIHEVRTESINSNILYTNLGKSQKFEKWAPHKFIKEYLNTRCFFFSFFVFLLDIEKSFLDKTYLMIFITIFENEKMVVSSRTAVNISTSMESTESKNVIFNKI